MKICVFLSIFLTFGYFACAQQHQQPNLILPVGHTHWVRSASFSPDGKYIVTASSDNTAKIWDAVSGKLLQNLTGHKYWVNTASFSSDGKYIVTASWDKTAKIWEVASGKMLRNIIAHNDILQSAQFSPDGKFIVTASRDKKAKIWDAASGRLLHNLRRGHKGVFGSAYFSPDGKYVVSVFPSWAWGKKTAKIWEATSGRLLNLKGHSKELRSVQFSPDGQFIVTSSDDETVSIWDATSGKFLKNLTGHRYLVNSAQFSPDGQFIVTSSNDETANIWEVASGKVLHVLRGHKNVLTSAQFSPNGKLIVTTSRDSITKIWDAVSGKTLHNLKGHYGSLISAQFSPDGKRIITASSDKLEDVKIWDVANGEIDYGFRGYTTGLESAQLSPDGKVIVTASSDGTAKILDIASGRMLYDLIGHTNWVSSAQFSTDGKYIVTASGDGTAKIWDVSSSKILYDLKGHTNWVDFAQFSTDGKYVLTSGSDNVIIWNAASGKILHDLKLQTSWLESAQFSADGMYIVTIADRDKKAKIWDAASGKMLHDLPHKNFVNSAQFSPDGKSIVTTSRDKTAKIWEVASGKLLHVLRGHTFGLSSARFSPNGKFIVTTSCDQTAKIWNVSNGKMIQKLIHTDCVSKSFFSPDGNYVVTASEGGTANIWNLTSGKLLHVLKGHTSTLKSAQFSPDGTSILTTSIDHKTILWDATTGKMRYARLQLSNNDWLVYDEDYRYDGSPGARDYLYFVCGLEIVDLAQMKDALYVPGLVEKIMNGEEINYPRLSELDICEALPVVERMESEQDAYRYKIKQRRLTLQHVEVYINNKRVYTIQVSELKKEGNEFILDIREDKITRHFMEGRENKVEVIGIVFSSQGNELKSRGAEFIFSKREEKVGNHPKLFAVMVGVNEYKDPDLKLNYPSKDAIDLGLALESSASRLLGKENVFLYSIHTGVNGDNGFTTPEKEGVRKALEDIGKRSNPEDVILLFFAGHGVMEGREEKLFTFLTAETSKYNLTGINSKELLQWISYEGPNKILANKTILIFDACNSGQATQELIALARNDENTRRIRQVEDLKDKSGMFILTASAPNQSAYELPQYEQGLLTYSLLSVLKNNPDVLDDGEFLNVQKWFLESEKYLKQLVSKHGYQQDAQPYGTANIRIGIVDEGVRSGIRLALERPLILCANVLNSETYNDDIQLKELVNEKLAFISERGSGGQVVYAKSETPGANKINIIYDLKGDQILCRVRLMKEGETLHQAEVEGTRTGISDLVLNIIKNVVNHAK